MKAKKNISIEEQLRIAAAGAKSEGGSSFVNTIRHNATTTVESASTTPTPSTPVTSNAEKVASPPQPQQTDIYTKLSTTPYTESQVPTSVYSKPPIQQQRQPTTTPEPSHQATSVQYTPSTVTVDQESMVRPTLVQPVFTPSTPEYIQKTFEPIFSSTTQPTQTTEVYASTTTSPVDTKNAQSISVIIELTDMYRGLDHQVQEVIKRFVRVEKDLTSQDPKHLSSILIGILNVHDREKTALKDLIDLKLEERTSRAFSMVSLNENRLLAIQELVLLFNTQYTPQQTLQSGNKILFCKELEGGIDTLSHSTLELLKPIDRLFSVIKPH